MLQRPLTPDAIDGAITCSGHQPGAGMFRRTFPRPSLGGDGKGLLGGLLGEIDVAEEANQVGKNTSPLFTEDPVDDG